MKTLRAFLAFTLVLSHSAAAQQSAPPQQWAKKATGGGLPSVSPDDKYIAFSALRDTMKPSQIYIIHPDGSGEKQLTVDGAGGFAQWSPNSQVVAIEGRGGMMALSLDGSKAGLLRVPAGGRGYAPSPDNRWLAYSSGNQPAVLLTVSAIDGTGTRTLTTSGMSFNGTWSPDGKRIAYARIDSTRDMQVWVVNADGTGNRQVTHFPASDGRPQWPSWSPDGRTLAVQAGNEGASHIWLVDVASGNAKKLAPHTEKYLDETPFYFHDGKRIAFQSDRTGRMEIWVMNADGTGARQVTR